MEINLDRNPSNFESPTIKRMITDLSDISPPRQPRQVSTARLEKSKKRGQGASKKVVGEDIEYDN
jgi:hypothetical protein